MALQLWLPLNGDLRNQGLSSVTVTNNGATVDDNGKTGKCYSFDGISSYIEFTAISLTGDNTICCWLDLTNISSTQYFIQFNNSRGIRYSSDDNSFLYYAHKSNNLKWTFQKVDGFVHVAFVCKSNSVKLYVNGTQVGNSQSRTVAPACTGIGRCTGGYYYNGKISDFRIYDHALSPKEVKEISKGLILHYPLDNGGLGNLNLLTPTLLNNSTPWTSAVKGTEVYKDKKATLVNTKSLYQNTSNGQTSIFPSLTFEPNTQYTLSVDWCEHLRTDNNTSSLYLRFRYDDGTRSSNIISPTNKSDADWVHASVTSEAGKTVTMICSTYSYSGNVSIANIKLEKGAEDTGYGITEEDPSYGVVYDCSGFGNNGTAHATFPISSDTPRYGRSTVFSDSNFIAAGRGAMVKDAISICCWAYMSDWSSFDSRLFSCIQTGGWVLYPMNNKMCFAIGTGTSSNTYKYFYGPLLSSLSSGWHHLVGTYDGFKGCLYIDGALSVGTTVYETKTPIFYNATNGIFIGAEAVNSATVPTSPYFSGNMSDARIYATAISAEDVKELYDTSAFLTDNGTLYGYELKETTSSSVNKNGVVETEEFTESDLTTEQMKVFDDEIHANIFNEI